jgi:hypothetical protein
MGVETTPAEKICALETLDGAVDEDAVDKPRLAARSFFPGRYFLPPPPEAETESEGTTEVIGCWNQKRVKCMNGGN